MDQASNVDMAMYASDSYSAWTTGRQRGAYMGNGGDHASIGPLTQWDARLLQTGDPRAALASEVNALACLGWNINHRNLGNGRVPSLAEVAGKSINGTQNWPHQRNAANAMQWEVMHHPATGLMAFVGRPSPVFIELAQKVALWNALWSNNRPDGGVSPTGLFARGDYPTRGRAWSLRSLAHATFLTPDGDAWKSAGRDSLSLNVDYLSSYINDPKSKLNVMWEGDPGAPQSAPYATAPAGASFALAGWMYQYLLVELHKIASARLLAGTAQAKLETLANWTAQFPVRWVNEQTNGGWRYIPYATTIGRNPANVDMLGDWGSMRAYHLSGQPPAIAGPWFSTDQAGDYSYELNSYNVNNSAGSFYPSYFWAALVAAVERGVPGANAAWATVNGNVTTLATWRRGFMTDPRWGSAPRTVVTPVAATPTTTGSLGALENAASGLGPGQWLDWSAATNVRTISDTNPTSGLKTAWLESKPNYFLTNWPGNITWDAENKRIILVGASQNTAADNPAGWSSAAVFFDVSTGVFSKQWNPVGRNLWHVYDSNSTRPLGGFIYRTAPAGGGFWKMNLATKVWSAADSLAGINLTYAAVPALEVHPTLGAQGSILVSGSQGRLGVLDRATGVARQLASSLTDVNGLSPAMSYHPGIDAVVFGGSENSKSLYKIDNLGAITLLSNTLPPGVKAIGPTDATVLAPDPQGRRVAWLYDQGITRKIWKLDLGTGAWSDAGAMPAGFSNGGAACVATIPELGVHVWLDGYGRLDAETSNSRVWIFKPQ